MIELKSLSGNVTLRRVLQLDDLEKSSRVMQPWCGRSLDIDEQIALKDIFAFLVLLRFFVSLIIFPTQCSTAFAAVDISDSMIASSHWAIVWLPFNDVDDDVKKIRSAMLAVESPRNH